MNFKSGFEALLNKFKQGQVDVDMSYSVSDLGVNIESLSFHTPYEWNGKKEPPIMRFDMEKKVISLTGISHSNLKDPTMLKFFALPTDFMKE